MSLTFDLRDFQRIARKIQALENQIPFALAQALNASAEIARREIIDTTWPQHVQARNASFMRGALSTKGTRATKRNLRVEVYDRLGRASLSLHDAGGSKRPRGSALAIPNKMNLQPKRSGRGVPKGLRPRNLPNSFVKQSKHGPVLFQRTGSYIKKTKNNPAQDNRGLKAMYGLAPSAPIKADVPFHRDFNISMRRAMPDQFRVAMKKAMATAFKR